MSRLDPCHRTPLTKESRMIRRAALTTLLLATAAPVLAENSKPQPVPYVDTIPAAQDIRFPGTITLDIDATDTRRGIFTTRETISGVSAGHMVDRKSVV